MNLVVPNQLNSKELSSNSATRSFPRLVVLLQNEV